MKTVKVKSHKRKGKIVKSYTRTLKHFENWADLNMAGGTHRVLQANKIAEKHLVPLGIVRKDPDAPKHYAGYSYWGTRGIKTKDKNLRKGISKIAKEYLG